MLRSEIPEGCNLLCSLIKLYTKPVHEIRNSYEFKSRWATDGSNQEEGVDFDQSHSPVASDNGIRMVLCIAASNSMLGFVIDAVNAFQTRYEPDPSKRQYITLP